MALRRIFLSSLISILPSSIIQNRNHLILSGLPKSQAICIYQILKKRLLIKTYK